MENLNGKTFPTGLSDIPAMIEFARPKIFDFSYPLYEGIDKQEFETNIIRNFYMREIGLETYALWKFYLENKMIQIMPYYNKLFEEQFKYGQLELFGDVDLVRQTTGSHDIDTTHNMTGNGSNSGTSNHDISGTETNSGVDSVSRKKDGTENVDNTHNDTNTRTDNGEDTSRYSDTPQGALDGMTAIRQNTYLTNATINDHNNTINDTSSGGFNTGTTYGETGSDSTTYGKQVKDTRTDNRTDNFKTTKTENSTGSENKIYGETVTEKGRKGNIDYTRIYSEFYDKFQNIYKKLYRELETLFMNVW